MANPTSLEEKIYREIQKLAPAIAGIANIEFDEDATGDNAIRVTIIIQRGKEPPDLIRTTGIRDLISEIVRNEAQEDGWVYITYAEEGESDEEN